MRQLIFLSSLLILLHCQQPKKTGEDQSSSNRPDKQDTTENTTLPAIQWIETEAGHGWQLELFKDKRIKLSFQGEGCGEFEGRYSMQSTTLSYEIKPTGVCPGAWPMPTKNQCALSRLNNHLFFQYALLCRQQPKKLFAVKLKTGQERSVDGVAVITLAEQNGAATSKLYMRSRPSKESPPVTCNYGGMEESFQLLEQDQQFVVIARTKEKFKVGQWENYWYHIDPARDWYSQCDKTPWVFGQFVKLEP